MCVLAGVGTGAVPARLLGPAGIHSPALVGSGGLAKSRKSCVETCWNVDLLCTCLRARMPRRRCEIGLL